MLTEESGAGQELGEISISSSDEWMMFETDIEVYGKHAFYLKYEGSGMTELLEIIFLNPAGKILYDDLHLD